MKKWGIILGLLIFSLPVLANPGNDKSFLIIFHKSDLKNFRTSAPYIELSLMTLFETKAYTGNSDAAILVKVPDSSIDANQLGAFFVKVNSQTVLPIEDFAYKIIDIDQNRETFKYLLSMMENKNLKTKKNMKGTKSIPSL